MASKKSSIEMLQRIYTWTVGREGANDAGTKKKMQKAHGAL